MSTPQSNYSFLQIERNNHQRLKAEPEIKWHHFSFWIPERLQWLHFREGQLKNSKNDIDTKITKQLIQDATINVHNEQEIELTDFETKDNFIGQGSIFRSCHGTSGLELTRPVLLNPLKTQRNILKAFKRSRTVKQLYQLE